MLRIAIIIHFLGLCTVAPPMPATFVLVPGIGADTKSLATCLPAGSKMICVDFDSSLLGKEWVTDVIDACAARLLRRMLEADLLTRQETRSQAILVGHSAGGCVVEQTMQILLALSNIVASSSSPLSESMEFLRSMIATYDDTVAIEQLLTSMQGKNWQLPDAAVSIEGSIMPCDVQGWCPFYIDSKEIPEGEDWIVEATSKTGWTWPLMQGCCRALMAHCGTSPPRHLATIKDWVSHNRSFYYLWGRNSENRNDITADVLPALQSIPGELELLEIEDAGHNVYDENPEAVRSFLERISSKP